MTGVEGIGVIQCELYEVVLLENLTVAHLLKKFLQE
jgi:hypothetical protein